MAPRRISSSILPMSAWGGRVPCQRRSRAGSSKSLLTMVARAMVSTMTMPVAADRPPMKTNSASQGWPRAMGRVRTKVSASTPPAPKVRTPARAMGRTKRLMSSR